MIDSVGIEQAGTALEAVDLVVLLQQEFSEIDAVLTGNARDEGDFVDTH
jgi:hypothetical protein